MTVSIINDCDNSLQVVSTTGVTKTSLATNMTNIETTANDTPVDDDRDDLSTPDEDTTTSVQQADDMSTMMPPSLELVKVESVKPLFEDDSRDDDNIKKEDTKSSNKNVEAYPPMSTEAPLPSSIAKTLPLVRNKSSPVASSADLKSSIVDDDNNYEVEVTFQRKGYVPQAVDDVGYVLGFECGTAPKDELECIYKKKETTTTNNDSTIPVELSPPTPLKDRVSSIISYASSTANASLHSTFVKKTDGGVVRRDIMAASVDIVGDVAYLSYISTHLRRVDNIQALALFAVSLVGFILSSWVIIASCGRKYGTHEHLCCNVPRLSMYLILLHHIPVCFLVSVIDVGSLGGTIAGLLNICSTLLALSNSVYTTKCGELCGEGAVSDEYYEKESNASTVSSVADDDNSVATDYVLAVV